jgi:dTDP-4-dehydrorhamnose reductase
LILITGASGLLGANLALQWSSQDRPVVALYLRHPIMLPKVESLACDLLDESQTTAVISRLRPQWIIHCAAATNVDWCQNNPEETFRLNVEASRRLAAAAHAVGSRLVHISTDSVFDGTRGRHRESDLPAPLNLYARSKFLGELAVAEQLPSSLIVRTNVYGWNLQKKNSLAEWMLGLLEQGKDVPGFHDVVFSPILVNDLADVLLEMMALRLEGIFHIGASESCSKYEFGRRLAKVFGLNASLVRPCSISESPLPVQRPLNTSMAIGKAERGLGRALPRIMDGLQRFKALRQSGFAARLKAAGEEMKVQSCPN